MLRTSFSPSEIREKLDAAARKGRMPGLNLDSKRGLLEIRDFGQPFESVLVAKLEERDTDQSIRFSTHIRPVFPTVFAIMLLISIWPGIYLVDSMLVHYFSWYSIPTWWWYLPLTVPTSPWMFWSALKKSRASAAEDARTLIAKVAAELHASPVEPAPSLR